MGLAERKWDPEIRHAWGLVLRWHVEWTQQQERGEGPYSIRCVCWGGEGTGSEERLQIGGCHFE